MSTSALDLRPSLPVNDTISEDGVPSNDADYAYGSYVAGVLACLAAWLLFLKYLGPCIRTTWRRVRYRRDGLIPLHDLHHRTSGTNVPGTINFFGPGTHHHHYGDGHQESAGLRRQVL